MHNGKEYADKSLKEALLAFFTREESPGAY